MFFIRLKRLLVFSVVGFLVVACTGGPKFNNTDITGSALTAQFQLTDLSGQLRTLADYRGKVVAMFFGYTHCPDVCPITLSHWAEVKKRLGDEGDDLQVLFVSVDPERDTPELLSAYVPQFDSSFNALTGTLTEIEPLLKGMRIFHARVDGDSPTDYLIDHSSSSYVIGKLGSPRLLVRHNSDLDALVQDVQTLLDE